MENPQQQPAIDDYARERVPDDVSSSGFHLALIIIGGTIGFAVFLVAAQIGGSLGYVRAGFAFALGSLVLGAMGATTSYVGAKTRFSTYLLTEFAFGRDGAKIANLAIALSLIGWYGVISNFLGQAAQQVLLESFGFNVSPYITVLVASTLMITITAMGFTGIDKLALVLVPFMVLFILYAAFISLNREGSGGAFDVENSFTFQTAVSAVIGSYIAGVVIQPDYSRFAVNTRQAIWSVFIALGVIFPLVQFFSAIPSMATGEPNLLTVMVTLGVAVPAFFLLLLGAWSSNVLCLYSSGLSIATVAKKIHLVHIIVSIGIIGTAIALVPAQTYLINFLVLLGVTIPPIGAIYIVEAMFVRRFSMNIGDLQNEGAVNYSAFMAWGLAALAGYLSESGIFGIVNISSIDSLIVSTLVYVVLNWARANDVRYPTRGKQL